MLIGLVLFCLALAVLAFLTATILSFATRKQPLRSRSRKVAWTLACVFVGIWAIGFAAIRLFLGPPPPTVAELVQNFPHQRQDLERILQMSNVDSGYSRIATNFVWTFAPTDQHVINSQDATMPTQRWDQYREIYRRNKIKLGVNRDTLGNVFIIVDSEGLLNRGHASGYLYCHSDFAEGPPAKPSFEPCATSAAKGQHRYEGNKSEEGYEFEKVADHWYALDQGPS